MGDKERGRAVAKYIKRNFPSVSRVISVADGNLILAREIYQNYRVTVFDPYIRNQNQEVRRQIKLVGKPFYSSCSVRCDLIIGLHPDQATGEIIDYVIKTRTACLLVPCCMVGRYADECGNKARWIKFLVNKLRLNGFDVYTDNLPIAGSNQAIRAYSIY